MCDASIRFTSHGAHKSSNDEHFRTFGKLILVHRCISHDTCMDVYGSNESTLRKKRKKKKKRKKEHNNAQQCERVLTQLLHGDIRHTIRYDMS